MKSMMVELTDETNMARGFSFMSLTWTVGATLGSDIFTSFVRLLANIRSFRPFIGGMLSRPQDRWPNLFSHPFWNEFPYFLPCLATATYGLLSLTLAVVFLKEVGSPLVKKCCAHAFLDCEYRPRSEAQYRGQRGASPIGRSRNIEWTCKGHGKATTTACSADKTSRGIGWELCHVWTTRYNECISSAACLVDISGVWWARHEPCVYWLMDSWIWDNERRLPIRRFSAHRRALRPAVRLYRQHLLFCPSIHPVPPGESGVKSLHWRPEHSSSASYRAAVLSDMLLLHGIR